MPTNREYEAMRPDLSVIICTRNRPAALADVLASLAVERQVGAPSYEVIVVDSAPTDTTRAIVTAAAATVPVRYFTSPHGGSRARNLGLTQARGWCLFNTDDDCIAASDWLVAGAGLLADDPRQVIGGRVLLHDPLDLPMTIKVDTAPMVMTDISKLNYMGPGCNLIFGRCVFEEIGGYDPLLGAASSVKAADDWDIYFRAFLVGIPVRYEPTLVLAHHHGRRTAQDKARLFRYYEMSRGALAIKHALRGRLGVLKSVYWSLQPSQRWEGTREGWIFYGAFIYLRSRVIAAITRSDITH